VSFVFPNDTLLDPKRNRRGAPDLGMARRRSFWALYGSSSSPEVLLAPVAIAPSRGEVGRGPAAHARLDSGRQQGCKAHGVRRNHLAVMNVDFHNAIRLPAGRKYRYG
jgi:hypothetical protein